MLQQTLSTQKPEVQSVATPQGFPGPSLSPQLRVLVLQVTPTTQSASTIQDVAHWMFGPVHLIPVQSLVPTGPHVPVPVQKPAAVSVASFVGVPGEQDWLRQLWVVP